MYHRTGFIPSNLRPAINLPHCNGLLSSEVFSDRKHAHIKTIAATNKNTKSVGVIAVLSNADISTLKAIKQASKMLVKKLGFIEIRRCTFPNTLQRYELLKGSQLLLLQSCMLQAILNPWSNQGHPLVQITFDLIAHNIWASSPV